MSVVVQRAAHWARQRPKRRPGRRGLGVLSARFEGLGTGDMARRYAIKSRAEAVAYGDFELPTCRLEL